MTLNEWNANLSSKGRKGLVRISKNCGRNGHRRGSTREKTKTRE